MHVVGGVGMVAQLCMPNYSGKGTNSHIKVCMVCEVCLFSWMGVRPVYIEFSLLIGRRKGGAAQYVYGFAGTHGMHVLGGVGMVAQLCMPNYSGKGTNSHIKVCMVCEVCLFSWMGVRPIYIDLNMYMGSRVRTVCMSWVG